MAAYNIVVRVFKNGTVDAETVTVAFDDSTDISKSCRIVSRERGVQVGMRLNENDRNIDVFLDSLAEYREG